MSKIKDEILERDNNRFDDSGYETLSEENKIKKLVDFHSNQIDVIQQSLKSTFLSKEDIETLREDKLREEADNRDMDIANGWYPEE